jgi:threonylcarbamoyladenosine tRNA methylthiotransferase MtaB
MLHILSEKKRRHFYESNIGAARTVLFENDVSDGLMRGFTENYIPVTARYDPMLINEMKPVILSSLRPDGLMEAIEPTFAVAGA